MMPIQKIRTRLKNNWNLFVAECTRAVKLLVIYPIDTVNNIISFLIVSVIFMIGVNAVGDSSQAFGVIFFPIMLNLIGGLVQVFVVI